MKRRITHMFLRGRFSAGTEQRVQRWLAAGGDDKQASREFWDELASIESAQSIEARSTSTNHKAAWRRVAAKTDANKTKSHPQSRPARRWASIAASAIITLSAAAGSIVWYHHNLNRTTQVEAPQAEKTLQKPLIFEDATAKEILVALSERFNVTISANAKLLTNSELYTVKFPKGDNLTSIIKVLQDVFGDFTYTQTGTKINITLL